MSTLDVFCFDEFPSLLDRKPSSGRRTRGLSERKGEAPPSTIVKTFLDQGLGRRRRAKLLSECEDELACDVPYSLHRKNRWAELDTPALLGDGGDEVQVAVVERSAKKGTRLVNAVHFVGKDGCKRSSMAKGRGADEGSMLQGVKEQERPVLLYSLCKTPPGEKSRPLQKKTARRAGAFTMTDDDVYVPSESEEVIVEEMPNWRRSREPSFCLGDYIVPKQDFVCTPSVKRGGSPNVDMTAYVEVEPEECNRPSVMLVSNGTFKTITVETEGWTTSAHEQMRILSESNFYARWLDANERRLMFDLSTDVLPSCAGRYHLVVVVEKSSTNKTQLRVTINSIVDINVTSLSAVNSLSTLLSGAIQLCRECTQLPSTSPLFDNKVNPVVAVAELVPREHVMAEHRDLSVMASDEDDFDRILDSENEENLVCGVRCDKCDESRVDELFEMEEDWLCRGCLTQTICTILKNKMIVKINVPLACHSFSTPLDALPLFVPLSALNIYMRSLSMAIAEILKGDGSIVECKKCENLLRIKEDYDESLISCPACSCVSCMACGKPAHGPLSCEDYSTWMEKFDASIESLRLDSNPKQARSLTCECGEAMLLPLEQREVVCRRCHVAFDAVTLMKKRGGALAARASRLVTLPPRTIAKEFAGLAALALGERLDARRRASYESAVRKLIKTGLGEEAAIIRNAALHEAEMYAASAYLSKMRSPKAALAIYAAWEQLRTTVVEEKDAKRAARALVALKEARASARSH